jgi:hypothetical protein
MWHIQYGMAQLRASSFRSCHVLKIYEQKIYTRYYIYALCAAAFHLIVMGNLVERSAQPDLISGTHLALLENLDPESKFVAAHAQYHIRRKRRRDANEKNIANSIIERTRSIEWSKERAQEQRTGDVVDPAARLLESTSSPLLLGRTPRSTERITLQHIRRAVARLKSTGHLGRVGAYSVRRRDFLALFAEDAHEAHQSINDGTSASERVRNMWSVWCEAAAEDDDQQARVDALQIFAGLIWLVPGSVGHERLHASMELFDPRWVNTDDMHRQHDDGPRNKQNAVNDLGLSQHEVSSMLMTTLSGLCVWTDGFFLPPQASQITQISQAIFQEKDLSFGPNERIGLTALRQCAAAMEQVSLERLLCAEGLSKEMDDNVRSTETRRTWMETFYYASYDEKRFRMLMDASQDMDELHGNRTVHARIERPTAKDILQWKHEIVGQHPPSKFKDLLTNVERTTLTLTRMDNVGGETGARRMELLTMYVTMNWRCLEELHLPSCLLTTAQVSLLSDGIAINDSIKILNISNNSAGAKGATAIGKALRLNRSILKLDISQNHIGDHGCIGICEALSPYALSMLSTEKLKKRKDCRDDPWGVMEVETNEDRKGRNDVLECLEMRANSIGCIGGVCFGDVLRTHPSLTSLNLRDNRMGDRSVQAIAHGIICSKFYVPVARQMNIEELGDRPSCPLTSLNLSSNEVHDDGVIALAKVLSTSVSFDEQEQEVRRKRHAQQMELVDRSKKTTFLPSRPNPVIDLIFLDLGNNRVKGRGASVLARSIAECPSLTYLNLSCNKIGFHYAGSKHEPREHYDRNVFNYDTMGPTSLAKMIDTNIGTLTHLDLSMNSIDSEGGRALLESLQWSEWLETLNLSGNEMSRDVVEEQEEIGDPRLDLTFQKRMRVQGGATVSLPTRVSERVDDETMGTGGLSVSGNSRSYHAGGASKSMTDYHYQHTRWSSNTRPEQRASVRAKLLPVSDNRATMDTSGSTPLQAEWSKLMLGNHSKKTSPLHTKAMLKPKTATTRNLEGRVDSKK